MGLGFPCHRGTIRMRVRPPSCTLARVEVISSNGEDTRPIRAPRHPAPLERSDLWVSKIEGTEHSLLMQRDPPLLGCISPKSEPPPRCGVSNTCREGCPWTTGPPPRFNTPGMWVGLSDNRCELLYIIGLCASKCRWREHSPPFLLMYATTTVLSVLTRTCCPWKKCRCFSASNTVWSSRQFMWNNCICELHVPFIILPSQMAPQPAREASVVISFLIRIVPMVTPVIRRVVHLQGRKARMHVVGIETWGLRPGVRFKFNNDTNRWKGRICKRPSGMTVKADATSPSRLRHVLNFSLLPLRKSVRQAWKASTLSSERRAVSVMFSFPCSSGGQMSLEQSGVSLNLLGRGSVRLAANRLCISL